MSDKLVNEVEVQQVPIGSSDYQDQSSANTKHQQDYNKSHPRQTSMMVDLESEKLSYQEARAIRVNIQHDVQQLKNRVRMLQEEE